MLIKERRKNGSLSVAYHNIDENGEILPSETHQSSKDECDVNKIIARHKQGIINTHVNTKAGVYADLSSAPSYQEALQTIINANNAFDTLPASTRKRFGNDPQEFLQFMSDPSNKEEAKKLGLLEEKALPANEVTTKQNTQNQNTQNQNPTPASAPKTAPASS